MRTNKVNSGAVLVMTLVFLLGMNLILLTLAEHMKLTGQLLNSYENRITTEQQIEKVEAQSAFQLQRLTELYMSNKQKGQLAKLNKGVLQRFFANPDCRTNLDKEGREGTWQSPNNYRLIYLPFALEERQTAAEELGLMALTCVAIKPHRYLIRRLFHLNRLGLGDEYYGQITRYRAGKND